MSVLEYSYADLVNYMQKNPSFISEIMNAISCYDLEYVKNFFMDWTICRCSFKVYRVYRSPESPENDRFNLSSNHY